jgi:hypothetical protein
MKEKENFFKNHIDTIAIITVNLAIAAIIVTLCISNMNSIQSVNSRIDAANERLDSANVRMDSLYTMFYDLLKEVKNK